MKVFYLEVSAFHGIYHPTDQVPPSVKTVRRNVKDNPLIICYL